MKNRRHFVWLVALALTLGVSALYQAGALQVPTRLKFEELSRELGVPYASLERFASGLPPGANFEEALQRQIEPHHHDWESQIAVIDDQETGAFLHFAHIGDGEFAGQSSPFQTTFTLTYNNSRFDSPRVVDGEIEFFDDDGAPLELEIDGVTASRFPFRLFRSRMMRLATSGAGPLKTGWARIRSSQPIVATSSFGALREDGSVITDVGVSESLLGAEFTTLADTAGGSDTGLALANPSRDQAIDIGLTLRRPDGSEAARTEVRLGPLGHLSRFLGQFFPEVEGIDEFQGSLHLRSLTSVSPKGSAEEAPDLRFVALALRVSGTVLTSVPLVQPPAPEDDFTNLAFPQAADGGAGDLSISTTAVLFNNTDEPASGVIEFFKGDGTPNEVRVAGESVAEIPFDIPPRGVFRADTDGTGPLAVGWARVSMDQPLAGVAIFTVRDAAGAITAAVGVESAPVRRNFQFFADTTRLFNTGLAVVNPLEPDEGQADTPVAIRFTLVDSRGSFVERTELELSSKQHRALFLTDLFPDVAGIDEFQGRVGVSVAGTNNRAAAVSLRSAQEKLTSVPVFAAQRSFAPAAEVRFAQHLRGTAPALRLSVHQDFFNWALDRAEFTLPGMGLDLEGLASGVAIGSGYLTRRSRLVRIVPASVDGSRLDFDFVLESDDSLTIAGRGFVAQAGEGPLVISLDLAAAPNSFDSAQSDTVVFLQPGVVVIPESLGQISSSVALTSVSRPGREGILRKLQQEHQFTAASAELASITRIEPLTLAAGEFLHLEGANFGEAPVALFPGPEDTPLPVEALPTGETSLEVVVPAGVAPGEIRVDNGLGAGSGHLTQMDFGPDLTVEAVSDEEGEGIRISILQEDYLFALASFSLKLIGADPRPAGGLEAGQAAGSYQGAGTMEDLTVVESGENRVVLRLERGSGFRSGDLVFERVEAGEGANPGWSVHFEPDERPFGSIEFNGSCTPLSESVCNGALSMRVNLPFLLPEGEAPVLWSARMTSAQAGIGTETVRNASDFGIVEGRGN